MTGDTRPEPRFAVGSLVLYVEARGDQLVWEGPREIVGRSWREHLRTLGNTTFRGWCYRLADVPGLVWIETGLRPYDPPADMSLGEVLASLSSEDVVHG